MSNILEYIDKNPDESQRLVGLKYDQLQQLLKNATELHNKKLAEIESRKVIIIKGERFRLNTQKNEQIIRTICGLVRLRIGGLILPT